MDKSLNLEMKSGRKQKAFDLSFLTLLFFVLVFIGAFSYLSIRRYNSFVPSVFDMGIMIQTMWNTSKGWFLQESINMGYPMMRFWMAHWEFVYAIIALVYKIFSTPYVALIFQSTVVALGAIPVYLLAKEKLNDHSAAFIFGLCFLLYPAIQNATLFDIHGVTLAAPFLLFTFYYLQKQNYKLFVLFGFIALICREDSALLLFMMGVYAFIIMKEKKVGTLTVCISLIYFLVWFKRMAIRRMLGLPEIVIMEGASSHWDHLIQIKEDPLYLVDHLAKKHNIKYFFSILGPVCLLSLFSPSTFLIASPIFSINLLSSYYYTHGIKHHYSAIVTPFVFISAIYGLKNLLSYFKKKGFEKADRIFKVMCATVVILSLLFFFFQSNAFDVNKWVVTPHHKTIKRVISKIPQDASLTAINQLVPHAAERREVYVFDDHVDDADYILYDFYVPFVNLMTRSSFVSPKVWPYNDRIDKVLRNRDYGITHYEDGVCLFQRGYDYQSGLKRLALSKIDNIDHCDEKGIGREIIFRGYNLHPILKMWYTEEGIKGMLWNNQLHFTCFWASVKNQLDTIHFIFQIQTETDQYQFDHDPVFRLYPTIKWKKSDIIMDEVFWEIPPEMTSGKYEVSVAIRNKKDSKIEDKHFIRLFNVQIENNRISRW